MVDLVRSFHLAPFLFSLQILLNPRQCQMFPFSLEALFSISVFEFLSSFISRVLYSIDSSSVAQEVTSHLIFFPLELK